MCNRVCWMPLWWCEVVWASPVTSLLYLLQVIRSTSWGPSFPLLTPLSLDTWHRQCGPYQGQDLNDWSKASPTHLFRFWGLLGLGGQWGSTVENSRPMLWSWVCFMETPGCGVGLGLVLCTQDTLGWKRVWASHLLSCPDYVLSSADTDPAMFLC